MKLKLIFITFFLLFYTISKSQKLVCLSGGISIPKVVKNYSSPHLQVKPEFKNTYSFALSYTDHLKKYFDLTFELNYVNTVVDLEITSGSLGGGYKTEFVNYNFGFLNVAVLPGFFIGKNLRFFVQVGPYFGFLTDTNKDAHGQILNPDIGINCNLGIQIQIFKSIGFVLKNGYAYGVANIDQVNSLNITILAGIYFSIFDN